MGADELWDNLAARLGVPAVSALGHYAAFTGVYGARWIHGKITGQLAALQDETIERWAMWTGLPGQFARVLRECCSDERGELKGFRRRNWKAMLKQIGKREQDERDISAVLAQDSRNSGAHAAQSFRPTDTDTDTNTVVVAAGPPERPELPYGLRCVIAANNGLRDNPAVNGFNELASSSNQEAPNAWKAAGIPVESAERTVYERALKYRPSGRNRQPSSLTYFDRPVRDAWEREKLRDLITDAALTEGERLAKELTQEAQTHGTH